MTTTKLALLDRDGVINVDNPKSIVSRGDFMLFPGVARAIKKLNDASIPVAIVTNQAVVGRGELSPEGLADIHDYLREMLKEEAGAFIDRIYCCTSIDPHHSHRKPNPGLLLDACRDFQVLPQTAVLIGDALRDLEAAAAINCPRILVRTGKGKITLERGWSENVSPVTIVDDLYEAVVHLLREKV